MLEPPLESTVQATIESALIVAGFRIDSTVTHRQKGPSGISKGIPDLLVGHELAPFLYLGMEVKRPGRIEYSSPEQKEKHREQRFEVVQDEVRALTLAHWFLAQVTRGLGEDDARRMHALDRSRRTILAMGGPLAPD